MTGVQTCALPICRRGGRNPNENANLQTGQQDATKTASATQPQAKSNVADNKPAAVPVPQAKPQKQASSSTPSTESSEAPVFHETPKPQAQKVNETKAAMTQIETKAHSAETKPATKPIEKKPEVVKPQIVNEAPKVEKPKEAAPAANKADMQQVFTKSDD